MTDVPFVLRLSDSVNSVDFLSDTTRVMDGGFDISLPRATRKLASLRNGFFTLVNTTYEHREAKLRFAVYGSNRSKVIAKLNRIERILQTIESRAHTGVGGRGELAYAWEGAGQVTFFEVYGGNLVFPDDILSVAKVHALSNGQYMLPDIELTLLLSPFGYGVPVNSNELIELPLFNVRNSEKVLGGLNIAHARMESNTGDGLEAAPYQCNWVEIDGADIAGGQPMLTKTVITKVGVNASPNRVIDAVYIGLERTPFAYSLIGQPGSMGSGIYWSPNVDVANGNADGGVYKRFTSTAPSPGDVALTAIVQALVPGNYYAFLTAGPIPIPTTMRFSAGSTPIYGGKPVRTDYVSTLYNTWSLPLGVIPHPLELPEMYEYGKTVWNDAHRVSVYVAHDLPTGGVFTSNGLHLLPVSGGLRILRSRMSRGLACNTIVDDGWRGATYCLNMADPWEPGATIYPYFYGLLDSLRLLPGISQRIHFEFVQSPLTPGFVGATQTWDTFVTDAYKVQVFGVPTYQSLAM